MSVQTQYRMVKRRFELQVVPDFLGVGNDLPVEYPNDVNFVTPASGAWVRISFRPAGSNQVEKGSVKRFRHHATMTVQIFVDVGGGEDVANGYADTIANVFRAVTDNSNFFRVPDINTIGRDGQWWQVNVDIPFYFDILTGGIATPVSAEMIEGAIRVLVVTWSKDLTNQEITVAEFNASTATAEYATGSYSYAILNKTITNLAILDVGGAVRVCGLSNDSNEITDIDGNVVADFSNFPMNVIG